MIRWIDQETFDEMILTNAEASLERMIDGAKPLLDTIRRFVPEAGLFYRIYHDESEHTNHVESVYPGFRRNGIQFFVSGRNYPKVHYDIACDCSMFRYADRYSENLAQDGLNRPNLIGVFTKRKIDDWVEYLTLGYRNMERINAENERKITSFRRQLDSRPMWHGTTTDPGAALNATVWSIRSKSARRVTARKYRWITARGRSTIS